MVQNAIRAILTNLATPTMRSGTDSAQRETLIDVADVALGHQTWLAWNPKTDWILSDQPAHEAVIDHATFEQVQARQASRGPKPLAAFYMTWIRRR